MILKIKKSAIIFLILISIIFNTKAQLGINPNGVYVLSNSKEILTIAPFGTQKALFLSDGHVFGLKQEGNGFAIGKTLGNTDEKIGSISFEKTTISLKYNDGKELVGEKVKLIETRVEFQNGKQRLVGELILPLYAEHDISTDSKTNLPLMQKLIPSENATFKLFENANHMMMKVTAKDFTVKQMPLITQLADGYMETLIGWLKTIVKTK